MRREYFNASRKSFCRINECVAAIVQRAVAKSSRGCQGCETSLLSNPDNPHFCYFVTNPI